jgi:hypothetical protein
MLPDRKYIRREAPANYTSFLLNCQFREVAVLCRCEQDFSQPDRFFLNVLIVTSGYRL